MGILWNCEIVEKGWVTYYRDGNGVCDGSNRRQNARIGDSWFSFRLSATVGLLVMVALSAMVSGLIRDNWVHLGDDWVHLVYRKWLGHRRRWVGLSATVGFITSISDDWSLRVKLGIFLFWYWNGASLGVFILKSLVTKCFRRYCPLLATNFSFVTKGARIC